MPTVTSRKAKPEAKVAAVRDKLGRELLALEKKLAGDLERIAAIELELKASATLAGESFKVTVAKLGEVTVQPGHEAEFKGNVPQIVTEAWLALNPSERKKYETSGVIEVVPQWGKKSSGRVSVELL